MTRTVEELAAIASFADALPVAVWVGRAPNGECVYVNREFERILGITPPEDASRGNYVGPYNIFTPSGEPFPEDQMPFEQMMRARAPCTVDGLVIHRHDGRKVHLRVFISPLFDEAGEIAWAVECFTDVTREVEAERKRLEGERALQAVQRLESTGSLAGGVAHDFNNLLSIVKLVAGQLRQGETDPQRLELVSYLDDVADSAAKLTRALLGFARRGRNVARPVHVDDLADSVVELARRTFERRIEIDADLRAGPTTVVGEAGQIEQVVVNLVLNARDAIARQGRIVVRTRVDRVEPGAHSVVQAGEYVVIEVEDNGAGIDPSVVDRVFEPYVTTKVQGALKGTGLGLATVYGVARSHGGHAEVARTSSSGTTMRVYFPAGERIARAGPAQPVEAPPAPATGVGTLLVVDDEPLVLEMTTRALTALGYSVIGASDGAAALEAFRARRGDVGAVLLDMIMPGPTARETVLALKEVDPAVRVLLMTGYALNDEAQRILDLGVKGFIAKPFDATQLARALASVLAP